MMSEQDRVVKETGRSADRSRSTPEFCDDGEEGKEVSGTAPVL